MWPVLIEGGGLKLATFDVAIMLAFLAGAALALARAPRFGLGRGAIFMALPLTGLAFWLGARIHFLLLHPLDWRALPTGLWAPGTAQLGGLLAVALTLALFTRRRGIDPLRFAVAVSPSFFLGGAIGRLGCLANGCCFGQPTSSWFGVRYPEMSAASRAARQTLAERGVQPYAAGLWEDVAPTIHPAPIYEALLLLAALAALLAIEKRRLAPSAIMALAVGFWGLVRIIGDLFRWPDPAAQLGSLSVNQWIGLAMVAASAVAIGWSGSLGRAKQS